MNILITGGLGFVGNHLVRHLVESDPGSTVVVVDDLSSGKKEFLSDISERFTLYNIDICDREKLNDCFAKERPDVVIHLAAIHFIPECNRDPERTMAVNVTGTEHVIESANTYGVRQVIFASSASVYGPTLGENTEDDAPNPLDVYGRSKLAGEELVRSRCRVNWTILRFFNVIGPNETHSHLLPAIIDQLKQGDHVTLGNMGSRRDYIFVKDIVRGVVAVIDDPKAYGEVLNLGTGRGVSAKEIIQEFEVLLGKPITVAQNAELVRKVDNPVLVASIEKSKRLLNWEPDHAFRDALRETFFAG